MEIALLLGKLIRERRTALGITQERLALMCGLDRSYMGRIERGEVNITIVSLFQIAKALDCSPMALLPEVAEREVTRHV